MRLRSMLFVPGDRPERMEKALGADADAIILDLEDSVVSTAKASARAHIAAFLRNRANKSKLFVRINPLDGGMLTADLDAVLPFHPDGIVLPKAEGGSSVARLVEVLGDHDVMILPIVTETAKATFTTGTYGNVSSRLCALTWGAEDLSSALGASIAREENGRYRPPYELARSLTLFGASAAAVPAIETVYPAFRDLDGLAAYASRARQDGFKGMMAIHPCQIPVINNAFRPSALEIEQARRIVELFAQSSGSGSLSLDGKMVDAPHLAEARRLLRSVEE